MARAYKLRGQGQGILEIPAVEIDAFLVDLDQDDRSGAGTAEQADLLVVDLFFEKAGDKSCPGRR